MILIRKKKLPSFQEEAMVSSKASQILFFKKYYFVVVVALCSVPAASLIFPVPREILTCSMCDLVP